MILQNVLSQRPASGRTVLLAIVLCVPMLWSCTAEGPFDTSASAPDAPPRHLILISIDTLRADHMSLYGYARATTPALDRRSIEGTVFEQAIAAWPKTGASFASMFLGQYPQTTGLTHKAALRLPESARTLPVLLASQGFKNFAVVSNPVLSADLGWDRGFDRYQVTWSGEMSNDPHEYRPTLNAERVNELALPLIDDLEQAAGAGERTFLWLHYSDPHAPYILPDGVENPFLADPIYQDQVAAQPPPVDLTGTQGREIPGETSLPFYIAQYDANILVADRAIDQALEALESAGILEQSLVVLVSDHGESLFEHGLYFEHGPLPYNTTARVPLVVWSPSHSNREPRPRVSTPVELVDLLPTVIEALLPAAVLPQLDGDSLWPLIAPSRPGSGSSPSPSDPTAVAFAESGRTPRHDRFVQDGRWKLIWRPPPRRLAALLDELDVETLRKHVEFYDLESDPGETRDLAPLALSSDPEMRAAPEPISPEDRQAFDRLARILVEKSRIPPDVSSADQPLGDEVTSALEALGYIE